VTTDIEPLDGPLGETCKQFGIDRTTASTSALLDPLRTGYLRLPDIIGRPATRDDPGTPALVPVCASTWWAGVRSGRYPQPTRELGVRITAWCVEDIRALLDAARPRTREPFQGRDRRQAFRRRADQRTGEGTR
jgi:predicted DNA-binding transcriptional regulator AlpA